MFTPPPPSITTPSSTSIHRLLIQNNILTLQRTFWFRIFTYLTAQLLKLLLVDVGLTEAIAVRGTLNDQNTKVILRVDRRCMQNKDRIIGDDRIIHTKWLFVSNRTFVLSSNLIIVIGWHIDFVSKYTIQF